MTHVEGLQDAVGVARVAEVHQPRVAGLRADVCDGGRRRRQLPDGPARRVVQSAADARRGRHRQVLTDTRRVTGEVSTGTGQRGRVNGDVSTGTCQR